MVRDVSATLVATTQRRVPGGEGLNTCSKGHTQKLKPKLIYCIMLHIVFIYVYVWYLRLLLRSQQRIKWEHIERN